MDPTRTTPAERRAPEDVVSDAVPTLTVIDHANGAWVGVRHQLDENGETLLGRAADGALPGVLDEDLVSRRHAVISAQGGAFVVRDLGSRNHTRVNGVAVDARRLAFGDVILIGGVLLLYHAPPRRLHAPGAGGLVGISAGMGHVREQIGLVASHDSTVVIIGETGVGKELVAQALHAHSRRAGGLVAVNCAGVADPLLHSELFGHVRGAFTGADRKRAGLIEAARGGTLFLDELTDASPAFQASLLRLLETHRYRPVGGDHESVTDARFVCAVQPRVEARIADGSFRHDLWTRLNQWPIRVPPLRDRPEDIPILARHFADEAMGCRVHFPAELMVRLVHHRWPGNVRGLKAFVQRLVVSAQGDPQLREPPWLRAELAPLPEAGTPAPAPSTRDRSAKRASRPTRAALVRLCEDHAGSVRAVAATLGVERKTVYRWLDALEVDPDAFRG